MGKKITTVGTSVARVIDDARLPNAIRTGLLTALFKEGDIVEHVQEELINSVAVRAERMYKYAESGDYAFGLPSGEFLTGAGDDNEVQAVLEGIEGVPVIMNYCHYGPPNNLHVGWVSLLATHGYNPLTNQLGVLTAEKGTPVYLDDMVVVVPAETADTLDPLTLEQWGIAAKAGYTPLRSVNDALIQNLIAPSDIQTEVGGTSEYLKVTYIWRASALEPISYGTFNIPITGYDPDAKYFQVRYTRGATAKYWIYRDGAGTYPTLDALRAAPYSVAGEFFPFGYFRFNSVSDSADTSSSAYLTGKRLMKYLGMDYDAVSEGVEANPDIDQVAQAMLMMAVPANTTNELERRYLFSFFDNLYQSPMFGNLRYTSESAAYVGGWRNALLTGQPEIVIQDTRFKLSVRFNGLYKRLRGGVIGPVGTHDSGLTTVTINEKSVDTVTGEVAIVPFTVDYHYFRRQVSKSFYEEIQVADLRTVYYILGDYKQAAGEDGSNILLIPLDRTITADYTIPEREELYSRSLHYVFNSVVVTKLKWYQTEFFQVFIIIVTFAVAIYTGNPGLLKAAALISAGAYAAAIVLISTLLLDYLIAVVVMRLFIKLAGARVAFIVAVIAALAGLAVEFDMVNSLVGVPWAQDLLSLASGLTNQIGEVTKDNMADLLGEAQDFEAYKTEQLKLLEAANELLEGNTHLNPFIIFGETPGDYYNRTVHSGNIGVVGIEAVSSFVDISLTLPKLNDSFGGPGYDGNV